jgi:hypothetical protein
MSQGKFLKSIERKRGQWPTRSHGGLRDTLEYAPIMEPNAADRYVFTLSNVSITITKLAAGAQAAEAAIAW